MFQIKVCYAIFDGRDAHVGTRTYRDEMCYGTLAGALYAVYARFGPDDYDRSCEIIDLDTGYPVSAQALARAQGINYAPRARHYNDKRENDPCPF